MSLSMQGESLLAKWFCKLFLQLTLNKEIELQMAKPLDTLSLGMSAKKFALIKQCTPPIIWASIVIFFKRGATL